MSRILERIGAFSAKRRWLIVIAWLVILAAVVLGAQALSQPMESTITLPGVQSISTLARIHSEFPTTGGHGGQIVFAAPPGHRLTSTNAATVGRLATRIAAVPGVTGASDPFHGSGVAQLSPGGRIGVIAVTIPGADTPALQRGIGAAMSAARSPSLQVEATSGLTATPSSGLNPLPGIILAFVILLTTLGALIAAGLPLLGALVGLGISLEALNLATHFATLNTDSPDLAILLGLAVGIDYSLFIVSRHRQLLLHGVPVPAAIARAVGTAGSAVVFAALTVIIALSGLAVEGIGLLTQMGLAAASAVLIAMLVSITLTPALLAIAKTRVIPRKKRRLITTSATPDPISEPAPRRWPRVLAAHPVAAITSAVVVLLILAAPAVTMRLGLPNSGNDPASWTTRNAYDLISEGFGPGTNGPLLALAHYPTAPTRDEIAGVVGTLNRVTNVDRVVPAGVHDHDVLFQIIPTTGPSAAATTTLVTTLRAPIVGVPTLVVSGSTAVNIDVSARLATALPGYLALIVGLAFVLLLIAFRSVLIPLKAVLGFALSLAATLGVTVAVFQWGWLGALFGVDPPAPILSLLPTILIGVLFGLSMDYEMFLLSGMREAHAAGATAPAAVHHGFATAARVVVAAALIMIGIFGNGAITGIGTLKIIAFALGVGVLLDAFIVRMTLIPAAMFLLGRTAWWRPNWSARLSPDHETEDPPSASATARIVPVADDLGVDPTTIAAPQEQR